MTRKVLIIDKDQALLDSLEKEFALHREIFSVIKTTVSKEAVQLFKAHFISLVVLELQRSDEEGIKLLTHLKTIYPDIPVIVISDDKSAEITSIVKSKGGTALVTKPFHADDLGRIILNILQKEAEGGTMRNVSPTVFLQLMEMESRTCTIRIIDKVSEKGGILYFREGELVDARFNRTYGIDAAYYVFGWETVTLYIENACPPRENVINSPLQPIIMKAVTLKDHDDEEAAMPDSGPVASVSPSPASPAQAPAKTRENGAQRSQAVPPPQRKVPPKQPVKKLSFIDKVRLVITNELGARAALEDIYEDRGFDRTIKTMSELENIFDFGPFKMVYVQNGTNTDRIILSADKTTVVDVNSGGQEEKIINALSKNL